MSNLFPVCMPGPTAPASSAVFHIHSLLPPSIGEQMITEQPAPASLSKLPGSSPQISRAPLNFHNEDWICVNKWQMEFERQFIFVH